ncbi:uncharacterized protein DS421_16g546750 [Arachis hypogaea]|nr:uncharacterized protein DS421_16g546750 [Arachis hypogaea]
MSSSSRYQVLSMYPNFRMRNSDNVVTFECENPILLRTRSVRSLAELKSRILGSVSGSKRKEIGRVGYRLLAPIENRAFQFRLFWLHGDEHVRLMFDIHGRIMTEQVMKLSVGLATSVVAEVGRQTSSRMTHFSHYHQFMLPI